MKKELLGSLLILTEDSGRDGHATIEAVVRRMLQLVVPGTQPDRLGFEPKNEAAQVAVHGSGWKRIVPTEELRVTLRTIATKLEREGFVLFHIDGDRTWPQRDSSENQAKFETLVVDRVRQVLLAKRSNAPRETIDAKLRRLIPIVPFYSIEAWLYQHTEVAIRICGEQHNGRHVGEFEQWKQTRATLDDLHKPKDVGCLGANHNLECAGPGYPAQDVFDAGRSYAACVSRLRENDDLRALLDATVYGAFAP